MNLRILLNNKEAVLDDDTEITLNYQNYLLDHEREDASYPLTLNLTANRHIFGFKDRINCPNVTRNYTASVYFGPYCIITGRAVVTDIENNNIELYIATDQYSFWADIKNTYLDYVSLGQETYNTHADLLTDFLDSLYSQRDFVACPLVSSASLRAGWYNYLLEGESGLYFPTGHANVRYIPFLRLSALIRRVFAYLGYSVSYAPILEEKGFRDILVINIRSSLTGDDRSFYWSDFVPHITVYDFLMEIERKFGVVFWVSQSAKTVNIYSLSGEHEVYSLAVQDGVTKHLLDEEEQQKYARGIKFKDKEIEDLNITEYKDLLEYSYGTGDDMENVDCISTIVGIKTDFISEAIGQPENHCVKVAALHYPETNPEKLNEQLSTELRFTVYRGICQPPGNDPYPFVAYPLASPVGFSYTESQYSLLWDYLFDHYHYQLFNMRIHFREEHGFTALALIRDLKNIYTLFESNLVIRNRKYLCSEQQITLSPDTIKEYTIKCLT